MVVIIDNYDSFTYNLVQAIGAMGQDLLVFRNNKVSIAEIEASKPVEAPIEIPEKAAVEIPQQVEATPIPSRMCITTMVGR